MSPARVTACGKFVTLAAITLRSTADLSTMYADRMISESMEHTAEAHSQSKRSPDHTANRPRKWRWHSKTTPQLMGIALTHGIPASNESDQHALRYFNSLHVVGTSELRTFSAVLVETILPPSCEDILRGLRGFLAPRPEGVCLGLLALALRGPGDYDAVPMILKFENEDTSQQLDGW